MYFHDKDLEYAETMVDWLFEIGIKNKIIHEFKNEKRDKEKVQRRRTEVFWMDFGVNIGSEFNYPHFCVVLREFTYHAIVVPISSVKKDAGQDWKTNENLFVGIGEISNLPKKQRNSYACVGQIRSVSKQRLSNYKYKGEFLKLKLNDEQMNKIDQAIIQLCTK